MLNIPIYRAKCIGSDEYIIGYYTEKVKEYPGKHYIHFNNGYTETYERIDPTTLAIHFKDMLDSEGTKIFASLSKDGKGGDVIQNPNNEEETGFNTFVVIYDRWQIKGKNDKYGLFGFRLAYNNKIIGIQK